MVYGYIYIYIYIYICVCVCVCVCLTVLHIPEVKYYRIQICVCGFPYVPIGGRSFLFNKLCGVILCSGQVKPTCILVCEISGTY